MWDQKIRIALKRDENIFMTSCSEEVARKSIWKFCVWGLLETKSLIFWVSKASIHLGLESFFFAESESVRKKKQPKLKNPNKLREFSISVPTLTNQKMKSLYWVSLKAFKNIKKSLKTLLDELFHGFRRCFSIIIYSAAPKPYWINKAW